MALFTMRGSNLMFHRRSVGLALVLLAFLAPVRAQRAPADVERRIDELVDDSAKAPTHDDLLEVRMDAARLAAELTRVRAELQYEIDRLATVLDDLVEPEPRRAAGWR
jgi:hypothetical protein